MTTPYLEEHAHLFIFPNKTRVKYTETHLCNQTTTKWGKTIKRIWEHSVLSFVSVSQMLGSIFSQWGAEKHVVCPHFLKLHPSEPKLRWWRVAFRKRERKRKRERMKCHSLMVLKDKWLSSSPAADYKPPLNTFNGLMSYHNCHSASAPRAMLWHMSSVRMCKKDIFS